MNTIQGFIDAGLLSQWVDGDDNSVIITPIEGITIEITDDHGDIKRLYQFEGFNNELWCFVSDNTDNHNHEFEIQASWQNNCGLNTPLPMVVI